MHSAGRPQTVLDLVREALLDSRRAHDTVSVDKIAKRLCECLEVPVHGNAFANAQERLPVESDRTTVFIPVGDIRYVEARGHVVTVAVLDRRFRFRGTLDECEHRLRRHGFVRAHRAFLVNAQRVVAVTPINSGLYVLHVDDSARSQIPVSRHYAPELRRSLAS